MPVHALRYTNMLLPRITPTPDYWKNCPYLHNTSAVKADMPCAKADSCPDAPCVLHIK